MTASHVSGPIVAYGVPLGASATNTNPDAGPSVFYDGVALFDPRYPYGPGAGHTLLPSGLRSPPPIRGFVSANLTCLVDYIPAAKGTVASGTVTALTMTTTQATWGLAGSMLLVPSGSAQTAANQVTVLGLDLGFGSCTTAATTAVTSYVGNDGRGTASLYVGQPIFISGGTSSTSPFFTYITAIGSATAFTIATAAPASASNLTVGSAHPSLLSPDPYLIIGGAYVLDPRQAGARVLSYKSSSASDDNTFSVTTLGYDVYGVAMTETKALNGTADVTGTKAFKYVKSCTVSATPNGTVTVSSGAAGTTDAVGFPLRNLFWEDLEVFYNGLAVVAASTGYIAAVTTTPATATTGDVRGTYALQAAANGSAPATGKRLKIYATLRPVDLQLVSAANTVPLFGVTQV